jgi:hypothetical protein
MMRDVYCRKTLQMKWSEAVSEGRFHDTDPVHRRGPTFDSSINLCVAAASHDAHAGLLLRQVQLLQRGVRQHCGCNVLSRASD